MKSTILPSTVLCLASLAVLGALPAAFAHGHGNDSGDMDMDPGMDMSAPPASPRGPVCAYLFCAS